MQKNNYMQKNNKIELDMKTICDKCFINPKAHSFKILNTSVKDATVFYTCPGEAEEYEDFKSVLIHYENMLKLTTTEEWIMVLDCDKLNIKHSLEFNTAKHIAELINTKYNNVRQIYIINCNNIINIILNLIWPFIDSKIKNLIIKTDILPFFIYK